MPSYIIHFRHPSATPASGDREPETVATVDALIARIDELSGRDVGRYIVARPLALRGRAYVAARRGGVDLWVREDRS